MKKMQCERCRQLDRKLAIVETLANKALVTNDQTATKLDRAHEYIEHLRGRIRGYKDKYEGCKDPGERVYAPVQTLQPGLRDVSGRTDRCVKDSDPAGDSPAASGVSEKAD